MKTLAIANHKGGVGKTATAHALGEGLAASGLRVLLVDLDAQASLTLACGITDADGQSMAEVLGSAHPGTLTLGEILRPVGANLTLAPGDIALGSTELGLVLRMGREYTLRRALETVAADFDVCLLDCPPAMGLLTVNALAAAHGVLVPTQPETAALRGLRLFLDSVAQVRADLNKGLDLVAVVATMYDGRLNHHKAALEALAATGAPVSPVTIGRSVRVAEAALSGQSVIAYANENPRAQEYRALTQEVIQWLAGE